MSKTKMLSLALAFLLALPLIVMYAAPAVAKAEIHSGSVGSIVVNDVKPNETFTATRIIETSYDGAILRTFAPGFSYGDNAENRSDRGLSAYLALSESAAKEDAVEELSRQITDQHETYRAVSSGTQVRFENLPMGQYIIVGTPADASRTYQEMLGNVEPTVLDDGEYGIVPVEISAKYLVPEEKPKLKIDKEADKDSVYRGQEVSYEVVVKPGDGSSDIRNLHIVDSLDQDTISCGMRLNQDVRISFEDGSPVEDAVVVYTMVEGSTVGYTIDVPGVFPPDTQFIVNYTGDTTNITENKNVVNIARTWCDGVEPVEDTVILPPDDTKIVETGNKTPSWTDFMPQTGDELMRLIVGIAAVAGGAAILVVIARKKKKENKR